MPTSSTRVVLKKERGFDPTSATDSMMERIEKNGGRVSGAAKNEKADKDPSQVCVSPGDDFPLEGDLFLSRPNLAFREQVPPPRLSRDGDGRKLKSGKEEKENQKEKEKEKEDKENVAVNEKNGERGRKEGRQRSRQDVEIQILREALMSAEGREERRRPRTREDIRAAKEEMSRARHKIQTARIARVEKENAALVVAMRMLAKELP